jgi:hypothetical protein
MLHDLREGLSRKLLEVRISAVLNLLFVQRCISLRSYPLLLSNVPQASILVTALRARVFSDPDLPAPMRTNNFVPTSRVHRRATSVF